MKLHQLLNIYDTRIRLAVQNENLKVTFDPVEIVRAPNFITFRYKLAVAPGQSLKTAIDKVLKLTEVFEMALCVDSVTITQTKGFTEVQIPSPARVPVSAKRLIDASDGTNVAVGLDVDGNPVYVDLAKNGCVGWIAPSRRGKTQSMKTTLLALLYNQPNLLFAIVCPLGKRADWLDFESIVNNMGIIHDKDEIALLFRFFANKALQPRGKYTYVIVLDDAPAIVGDIPGIADSLKKITSNGAGMGVHLLMGTQDIVSNDSIGSQLVSNNMTARICFKPANKSSGSLNAGSNSINLQGLSSQPGDAMLISDSEGVRIATAMPTQANFEPLQSNKKGVWYRDWNNNVIWNDTPSKPVATPVTPNNESNNGYNNVPNNSVLEPRTAKNEPPVINTVIPDDRKYSTNDTLTDADCEYIYKVYVHFGKRKEPTFKEIWGGKNGERLAILNTIITKYESTPVAANEPKILKMYGD